MLVKERMLDFLQVKSYSGNNIRPAMLRIVSQGVVSGCGL